MFCSSGSSFEELVEYITIIIVMFVTNLDCVFYVVYCAMTSFIVVSQHPISFCFNVYLR